MRRKIWLPLCLVAVLLAVSCGGGSPVSPPAAPEVPPAPEGARVSVPPLPTAGVPPTEAPPAPAAGTSTAGTDVFDVPWGERERLGAGLNYSCGLYWKDDSVECWYWGEPFRPTKDSSVAPGWDEVYDGWGEPSVETPEGGFVAVDAGREAACGIRPSGVLECWGASPLASVPPPGGVFVSVSVGIEHACGLRPGGRAECWGTSVRMAGAIFPPAGEFTSISASGNSMCGLRRSGEVECWGSGYTSSGEGDTLPPSGVFKAVSAGGEGDVCGLRLDNSVECWGNYDLYNYDSEASTYLLPPGGEFESVSLGVGDYACGLRPGGEAECWSRRYLGQAKPADGPPEREKFTQVEIWGSSACGVRVDNTLLCWSRYLEVNDSSFHEESDTWENVLQYEFGWGEVCALFVDGTVQCLFGETEAPPGVFSSVSAGNDHVCGLRPSGAVECWGSDEHGKASPPGGEFTELAASADFTCGLRPSGVVECWGGGRAGRHSKAVAPREPLMFIDAGWGGHEHPWPFEKPHGSGLEVLPSPSSVDWGYSCGLREDGSLFCWGNEFTNLEDIQLYDSLADEGPLLSPPEGVFVDVGVGRVQACALSITKEVKCWGGRGEGGEYTYGEKTGQVRRFDSLEVGGWHACGLYSDGRVECWNLPNQARVLPVPTDRHGGERRYSYISAGYFHVCGIRTGIDAGVDCWGPTTTRYEVGGRPPTDDDLGVM